MSVAWVKNVDLGPENPATVDWNALGPQEED